MLARCGGWKLCSLNLAALGQTLHPCIEVGVVKEGCGIALLADTVDHPVQSGPEVAIGPPVVAKVQLTTYLI